MSRLTLQGLTPAPAGEGWLGATLGTLWGLEGLYGRTRPVLFQTLIGTVKSRVRNATTTLEEAVSNPHRYGQKSSIHAPAVRMAAGFKPS